MCVIIDSNVIGQVFGKADKPAGQALLKWILSGKSKFIFGGKLTQEIQKNDNCRRWMRTASQRGLAREILDQDVTGKYKGLTKHGSDDKHILALAIASRTRLLFTNDTALADDFRDPAVMGSGFHGKVYTTLGTGGELNRTHKKLLADKTLHCP